MAETLSLSSCFIAVVCLRGIASADLSCYGMLLSFIGMTTMVVSLMTFNNRPKDETKRDETMPILEVA
jgi:hypothetical protein